MESATSACAFPHGRHDAAPHSAGSGRCACHSLQSRGDVVFKKLVLLQDQQFGLPTVEGLATLDGVKKYGKSPLLLAHPVDFNAAGLWAQWQSHLFAEKLVQPFKQVFRELYVTHCRRGRTERVASV